MPLDERLRQEIENIKIIDNHGHPGLAEYYEYLPRVRDVFRTPSESSRGFKYLEELHYEAYEKLYGFTREEIDDSEKRDKLSEVYESKRKQMSKEINQIMDAAGVETLIANYVLPESYRKNPRIKFIPSIDPLLFPFDNQHYEGRGKSHLMLFEWLLEQWKKKQDYIEKGLDNYLRFIDQIMDDFVKEDVVGFKFLIAYIRTTYFEKISEKEAPDLYIKAQQGDIDAYHKIQDYLAWYIIGKIVSLDMPIQFHLAVMESHVNDYDPLNLTNLLRDKTLAEAKIVVLHGGYPRYERAEALALAGVFPPNNVHIDMSGRNMLFSHPKIIAKMLRTWLEKPVLWNKILYGSDVIWGERFLYTCARNGREAVCIALLGMIDDEIIDESTAIMIANKILRDNALRLYKLGKS